MKAVLVIFVFTLIFTLGTTSPRRSYKVFKNPRAKEVSGTAGAVVSGDDVAVVPVSKIESTTSVVPTPEDDEDPITTKKSKIGEKPFGLVEPTIKESTETPLPVFPPAPEVETISVVAPAIEVSSTPLPEVTSASPTAPALVGPPEAVIPPINGTVSEEDDSSSEEADEEDDGRTLISKKNKLSKKKSKSFKMTVSPRLNRKVIGSVKPKGSPLNPPLKYDLIINGFVTEHGQVLVPFDTYQKYFHDAKSAQGVDTPPVYAITRQDETQGSTTSVVSSEESEDDKNSEESIPLPVSQTNNVYPEKSKPVTKDTDSSEAPSQGTGSSEEKEIPTPYESEEKEKPSVESEEKETPSNEIEEKPAVVSQSRPTQGTQPVFRPPSLQSLPARLPTDEDDEEEAGRFGFLPYDYDDDEPIHRIHHHHPGFPYDY